MLNIKYYTKDNKYGVVVQNNETTIKDILCDNVESAFNVVLRSMEYYYKFDFDKETKEALCKRTELEFKSLKEGKDKYAQELSALEIDIAILHYASGFSSIAEEAFMNEYLYTDMSDESFEKELDVFIKNSTLF